MRRVAISWWIICFFLAVFTGVTSSAQGQQSRLLVIEGGTLIDGTGAAPQQNVVIVIEGNQIQAVGQKGSVSYPSNSEIIQADGKFILPGLMDAHCHYRGWMPELTLAYGVTSVFEIGGGGEWGLAQRDGIERGKIPGPRLHLVVGSLAGGRISQLSGRRPGDATLDSRMVVTGAEDARQVTRLIIEAGADMVKVHRGPPIEAYRTAVEEAHGAGLPVVVQPLGPTVYAREAILAGADGIEHAAGVHISILKDPAQWKGFGEIEVHSLDPTPFADMDEDKARELIQLMVEREVWLEPDFIAVGRGFHKNRDRYDLQVFRVLHNANLAYIPEEGRLRILDTLREFDDLEPEKQERRQIGYQNMLRFIRQFAEAGGMVLAGTDAPGWAVPGLGVHQEMEILVEEVGFTPMEAILSATRNPAKGFRVLDQIGTIEAGKLADLIIIEGDPLADIRNTQNLEWVIKDGKVMDRSFHRWFENPLPHQENEGQRWLAALKTITWRTTSFGQPTPGIEAILPAVVTEGSPAFTLTIQGMNFTTRSAVDLDGVPLATTLVSDTELRATIPAELVARVGSFPIAVRNPEPYQDEKFGGISNRAYLLVKFR